MGKIHCIILFSIFSPCLHVCITTINVHSRSIWYSMVNISSYILMYFLIFQNGSLSIDKIEYLVLIPYFLGFKWKSTPSRNNGMVYSRTLSMMIRVLPSWRWVGQDPMSSYCTSSATSEKSSLQKLMVWSNAVPYLCWSGFFHLKMGRTRSHDVFILYFLSYQWEITPSKANGMV